MLWQLTWRLATCDMAAVLLPAEQYADQLHALGASCVWVDEPDGLAMSDAAYQHAPGDVPHWERPTIHALAMTEEACNRLVLEVMTRFPELGLPNIEHPDIHMPALGLPPIIRFGRLAVHTQRQDYVPAPLTLCIPAGTGFGTGTHPTTAMVLDWCAQTELANCPNVLDYGCGSGILGLAALCLGAGQVDMVDIDPLALEATQANAAFNQLSQCISVYKPSAFTAAYQRKGSKPYPLVFANILLKPLIDNANILSSYVADGGKLLLTGILEDQRGTLLEAYKHFLGDDLVLKSEEQETREGWSLVVITKA